MKREILIVEDNISLSQRQKDWLEQAGYKVMTAVMFVCRMVTAYLFWNG